MAGKPAVRKELTVPLTSIKRPDISERDRGHVTEEWEELRGYINSTVEGLGYISQTEERTNAKMLKLMYTNTASCSMLRKQLLDKFPLLKITEGESFDEIFLPYHSERTCKAKKMGHDLHYMSPVERAKMWAQWLARGLLIALIFYICWSVAGFIKPERYA